MKKRTNITNIIMMGMCIQIYCMCMISCVKVSDMFSITEVDS